VIEQNTAKDTQTNELDALRQEIARLRTRETAVAVQQKLLESIMKMAQTTPELSTLEATLQQILDVSSRLTGADSGSLFLLNADGVVTNSILTRRKATTEERRSIIGSVMHEGLAGWVARRRQIGWVHDTMHDERWLTLPNEPYSVRSALSTPITRGAQLYGILTLLHTAPNHFDANHVQLMQVTADQMSLVLDNARLYAAFQQELAERRRAEQALSQANVHLSNANGQLAAANTQLAHANALLAEAKEQLEVWLAARVKETEATVHDIRHGIRDAISARDMLILDLDDANVPQPVYHESAQRIYGALEALETLLGDMLDAAKLQGNALTLHPRPTDLAALVHQVAQRLEPRYRLANCTLTVRTEGELPPAWCDAKRMTRVLYNVLANAAHYMPERDEPNSVQVVLSCEGEQVVCRVIDNGIGIAPEHLERLGRRFARINSGAHAPEGSGLGLNFCIGVMNLLGGAFEIASPGPGHGTTVTLRLAQPQQQREVHR
jgi:signal transduction histidine kinase